LLKDIDSESLDFIRKCLLIDGGSRCTTSELIDHPIFGEEYIERFKERAKAMEVEDENQD